MPAKAGIQYASARRGCSEASCIVS